MLSGVGPCYHFGIYELSFPKRSFSPPISSFLMLKLTLFTRKTVITFLKNCFLPLEKTHIGLLLAIWEGLFPKISTSCCGPTPVFLSPDARQQNFINIIRTNLKEVISPFSRKLSSGYVNLTTAEIQVSDLIKNGYRNKEIAELLHISSETVSVHRKHIRKKLGIRCTKTNLRSYLKTIS